MYAKLIFRNARRSVRDYLIYIVTMTICVTLFYSFLSISSSYYHPDIGSTYDFTMLGDGMKMAICAITLILLFLIWFVNGYMLRRRQKEFALQSIMGMEQRTIGRLFFAETFLMGGISVAAGIFLGAFCSQFITAMLLTSYGQSYRISWMLFPDTVLLTVVFFSLSFVIVGLFNTRAIRKTKIIDMLSADRENEPELKKSRFLPAVTLLYLLVMAVMFVAFEWSERDIKIDTSQAVADVVFEQEVEIPITEQPEQVTPPPPVAPPTVAETLTIVDDDMDIEETDIASSEETGEAVEIKYVPVEVEEEEPVEEEIFEVVEEMPSFPGGQAALMQYLGKNIKYPTIAQENGTQGRVVCQFVVNRDGSIVDVKVIRGVDPYLDKEAVRVISSMPKWQPGKQRGKPVRVKYTVPVMFRLQ